MGFKESFNRFLRTISEKDIDGLKEFLDEEMDITIVLPKENPFGPFVRGYRQVVDSLSQSFSNPKNSMSFKTLMTEESEGLGFGAVEAEITLIEPDKPPYKQKVYISYLFKKVDGKWVWVHDQNTILSDQEVYDELQKNRTS